MARGMKSDMAVKVMSPSMPERRILTIRFTPQRRLREPRNRQKQGGFAEVRSI
jgi:hypothetical protein